MKRGIRHQIFDAAERLAAIPEGKGEAVHQARKAIARARGLLQLWALTVPEGEARRTDRALRAVARKLTASRDAQVMWDTFEAVSRALAPEARARIEAHLRVHIEPPDTDVLARKLRRIRRRVSTWRPREVSPRKAARGLEQIYARARRAAREAEEKRDEVTLHALRRRVRHLRTATRALAGDTPTYGALDHLSEALGGHHDLAVLREALVKMDDAGQVKDILEEIAKRQALLSDEALAASAILLMGGKRAFRKRIEQAAAS